ncbi:MAG: hypothetical protein CL561_01820 [Alphaproteobacteria bacterium]|nr:hypothetical protein [Alphaproteobacteria bacterium]|tara:strand:+ start:7096 stop:7296 length:201 start_codon:yes stop_codon:yes gene_type:complete
MTLYFHKQEGCVMSLDMELWAEEQIELQRQFVANGSTSNPAEDEEDAKCAVVVVEEQPYADLAYNK